jgi:TIMELESS-interacting protein
VVHRVRRHRPRVASRARLPRRRVARDDFEASSAVGNINHTRTNTRRFKFSNRRARDGARRGTARRGAATATAMSSKNKPCYKCGQGGHWAKDCTVPRERWISKEASDALKTREDGATTTTTDDVEGGARGEGSGDDRGARAEKRKSSAGTTRRPKFSVHDHLLGPNGLGAMYREFPEKFAARSKGEGHEEHDMNLLATMYKEWAVKMYPYAPAEETLARVDKLQSDKSVKMAVREFNELDFGGGVGEAVDAMERGENAGEGGEDIDFPDDDDDEAPATATVADDVDFPDDDVDFPDDDGFEEQDYVFDDDEDEDAARAMQEAEASGDDDDDEEEDEAVQGKRGKKIKGATDSTKNAFEKLAKKLGKDVPVANGEELNPNSMVSPQRKILRVRPKILDASSDEENEPPSEPARRRRAVHGMDDDEDE